jgi:hypothetical protein
MLPNLGRLLSSPFFQNKFVLYGSLVLVLLSILRHLANQNINAIVLMALIGLIMSYFSKNMIIVLLTAFGTVFVFEMIGAPGVTEGLKMKEGAENNSGKKDDTKDDNNDDKKDDKKDEKKGEKKGEKKDEKKDEDDDEGDNKDKKKKNGFKMNNKQGMTKLSPANYDGKKGSDNDGPANRIDYASTLEQAYDNIENIIGEDGVRGLTDQTKSLMNQQKMLMQNMKEMGPLLKSAEGFMEQITGNGGIGGITDMLKGFATPGGANKKNKSNNDD